MNAALGTKAGCANFCENRLFFSLGDVNAPFTTTLSFPPMFAAVL